MKTITAKELRNNLDQVLEEVLKGKEIIVKHRFKEPVKISSLNNKHQKSKGDLIMEGLKALELAKKKKHNLDSNKSFKQLYHEHLDEKYKS